MLGGRDVRPYEASPQFIDGAAIHLVADHGGNSPHHFEMAHRHDEVHGFLRWIDIRPFDITLLDRRRRSRLGAGPPPPPQSSYGPPLSEANFPETQPDGAARLRDCRQLPFRRVEYRFPRSPGE